MKKNYIQTLRKTLKVIILLMLNSYVFAQPPNSLTADPSATSVTQVPSGTDIVGSAVIQFKFTNAAAIINLTSQIPANSINITITFPSTCAFTSVNSIPGFVVISSSNQPSGVVVLENTGIIEQLDVIDLKLDVRGTTTGSGTINYNVSVISSNSGNINDRNDISSATFNTSTVLPVNLQSFDASINNCVSKINWRSNTEDNLKSYSLEYSNDGTKYNSFYEVNAKGNNNSYNTEHKAAEGKVFYRLKSVDFDGKYEYSKIISLNIICNKNWAVIYPNPTTQIINVNISTLNKLPTTVVLYDAMGKKILSQLLQNGINKIDVSKIALGIYTLTFSENTGIKNSSIIIK